MLNKFSMLLLLVSLISCGQSETGKQKDSVKVGVGIEAVTLYPYGSNDNATARLLVNIFDRLIEKDENGEIIPGLATAWKMKSPTQLELTLRENVLFHNGELFTAKDVKYSLQKMQESPEIETIVNPIKNVEIVSPYVVLINLQAPFAPILSHLAHVTMGIINQKAVEAAGANVGQQPVGTGAFQLKEWNRGQNIIVTANTNYWNGTPKANSIEFRIIPEASARTIALETGDIDIAYDIDPIDTDRISSRQDLQLIEKSIARIEYLGFNIAKGKNPMWKNPKVREAIALAVDTDGIINSVLFGAGTPADSIIYKSVIGYYDGLSPRKRDIAKAKALLAEAGVQEGTKVSLWSTEGQRQKIMEIIQANLREIGLDASIEIYEWARFLDGTAKGEHDLFILGWTTVTGDADYGIYNLIHTKAFGGPGNRTFYSNTEVDSLLDSARVELNPDKRNEMYKQVQKILYVDLPFIPLFYKTSYVGASGHIKGFKFDISDAHRLSTVFYE